MLADPIQHQLLFRFSAVVPAAITLLSNRINFVLWFSIGFSCQADNYKIPAQQQALLVARHQMTLPNFITLTFSSVLTLTNSFGQSKQDKAAIISQIKQVFRQINDYKNYKVVLIDDSEEFLGHGTDNGGSLKGYYKGDSLKKIVEWVGLSNRVVQNEYYFDKEKLLFVYSTDSRCKYDEKKEEMDCSKFEKIFKGRYYFSSDKLVDTILSDKEHEKTKQQDAADFLTSSKDYMKLLNARRQ